MNGRDWRVVSLAADGHIIGCYGYMFDEATARRVQRRFADDGAIVQHQEPPTVHPWLTVGEQA